MTRGQFPKQVVLSTVLLTMSVLSGCVSHPVGQSPYAGSGDSGSSTTGMPQAQQPKVIQADPAWFACKQDSDCKIERGVCGIPQAVNGNFLEQFRHYSQEMSQSVQCDPQQPMEIPVASVQCRSQRCSAWLTKHPGRVRMLKHP